VESHAAQRRWKLSIFRLKQARVEKARTKAISITTMGPAGQAHEVQIRQGNVRAATNSRIRAATRGEACPHRGKLQQLTLHICLILKAAGQELGNGHGNAAQICLVAANSSTKHDELPTGSRPALLQKATHVSAFNTTHL
jgi:hypothetical protein